jgi:hypothetical protein
MRDAQGGFWDDTAYVVVYLYRHWDSDRGEMVVSQNRATLEAIKSGLGMALTESGIKVPRTDLDRLGRYLTQVSEKPEETARDKAED